MRGLPRPDLRLAFLRPEQVSEQLRHLEQTEADENMDWLGVLLVGGAMICWMVVLFMGIFAGSAMGNERSLGWR